VENGCGLVEAVTTPSGKTFKVTLIKRFKIGDESGAILRILPTPK
jgi:hypothetical protein